MALAIGCTPVPDTATTDTDQPSTSDTTQLDDTASTDTADTFAPVPPLDPPPRAHLTFVQSSKEGDRFGEHFAVHPETGEVALCGRATRGGTPDQLGAVFLLPPNTLSPKLGSVDVRELLGEPLLRAPEYRTEWGVQCAWGPPEVEFEGRRPLVVGGPTARGVEPNRWLGAGRVWVYDVLSNSGQSGAARLVSGNGQYSAVGGTVVPRRVDGQPAAEVWVGGMMSVNANGGDPSGLRPAILQLPWFDSGEPTELPVADSLVLRAAKQLSTLNVSPIALDLDGDGTDELYTSEMLDGHWYRITQDDLDVLDGTVLVAPGDLARISPPGLPKGHRFGFQISDIGDVDGDGTLDLGMQVDVPGTDFWIYSGSDLVADFEGATPMAVLDYGPDYGFATVENLVVPRASLGAVDGVDRAVLRIETYGEATKQYGERFHVAPTEAFRGTVVVPEQDWPALADWYGYDIGPQFNEHMTTGLDLDGDGLGEVLIGMPRYSGGAELGGAVVVVHP